MKRSTTTDRLIRSINKRNLTNNTQRALFALLNPRSKDGWVARTSIPVSSATARIRDLRKSEYGGFRVECVTADELKTQNPSKRVHSTATERQTFYRLDPSSVTPDALNRVFKGVIS